MKNIKSLFLKSIILSAVFLTMSCSNDDDSSINTPENLYGTWEYAGYIEDGEFIDDRLECIAETTTFNTDNTALYQIYDCNLGMQSSEFNWTHNSIGTYTFSVQGEYMIELLFTFPEENTLYIEAIDDPEYKEVYIKQQL